MKKKRFLSAFPSSFTAWFITFLLALLAIAMTYIFSEKHPQLFYDIQASTSVFDIKEQLPKLDISYDGIDIREKNLGLRLVSLKVLNDSSRGIRITDYDPMAPIGIKVSSGRIVQADLTEWSNEYLGAHASLRQEGTDRIFFGSVILNPRQYFVVKLLILHTVGETPSISPTGYLFGMNELLIRETFRGIERTSIWKRAFIESWLVQTIRLLGYFVIGIAFLVLVSLLIRFDDLREAYRCKRNVRRYRKEARLILNQEDDRVFDIYINGTNDELAMMAQLLESEGSLRLAWEAANAAKNDNDLSLHFTDIMQRNGLIKVQNGVLSVNAHMKETLFDFLAFLKKNGLMGGAWARAGGRGPQ